MDFNQRLNRTPLGSVDSSFEAGKQIAEGISASDERDFLEQEAIRQKQYDDIERERQQVEARDKQFKALTDSGADIYHLPSGAIEQKTDPVTGRPLFKETDWEFTKSDQGVVEVKRNKYGEVETRAASLHEPADVNDPYLRYKDGTKAGHIDDLSTNLDKLPEHLQKTVSSFRDKRKKAYGEKVLSGYDEQLIGAEQESLKLQTRKSSIAQDRNKLLLEQEALKNDPNSGATTGSFWNKVETPEAAAVRLRGEAINKQLESLDTEQVELGGKLAEAETNTKLAKQARDIAAGNLKLGKYDDMEKDRVALLRQRGMSEAEIAKDGLLNQLRVERENMGFGLSEQQKKLEADKLAIAQAKKDMIAPLTAKSGSLEFEQAAQGIDGGVNKLKKGIEELKSLKESGKISDDEYNSRVNDLENLRIQVLARADNFNEARKGAVEYRNNEQKAAIEGKLNDFKKYQESPWFRLQSGGFETTEELDKRRAGVEDPFNKAWAAEKQKVKDVFDDPNSGIGKQILVSTEAAYNYYTGKIGNLVNMARGATAESLEIERKGKDALREFGNLRNVDDIKKMLVKRDEFSQQVESGKSIANGNSRLKWMETYLDILKSGTKDSTSLSDVAATAVEFGEGVSSLSNLINAFGVNWTVQTAFIDTKNPEEFARYKALSDSINNQLVEKYKWAQITGNTAASLAEFIATRGAGSLISKSLSRVAGIQKVSSALRMPLTVAGNVEKLGDVLGYGALGLTMSTSENPYDMGFLKRFGDVAVQGASTALAEHIGNKVEHKLTSRMGTLPTWRNFIAREALAVPSNIVGEVLSEGLEAGFKGDSFGDQFNETLSASAGAVLGMSLLGAKGRVKLQKAYQSLSLKHSADIENLNTHLSDLNALKNMAADGGREGHYARQVLDILGGNEAVDGLNAAVESLSLGKIDRSKDTIEQMQQMDLESGAVQMLSELSAQNARVYDIGNVAEMRVRIGKVGAQVLQDFAKVSTEMGVDPLFARDTASGMLKIALGNTNLTTGEKIAVKEMSATIGGPAVSMEQGYTVITDRALSWMGEKSPAFRKIAHLSESAQVDGIRKFVAQKKKIEEAKKQQEKETKKNAENSKQVQGNIKEGGQAQQTQGEQVQGGESSAVGEARTPKRVVEFIDDSGQNVVVAVPSGVTTSNGKTVTKQTVGQWLSENGHKVQRVVDFRVEKPAPQVEQKAEADKPDNREIKQKTIAESLKKNFPKGKDSHIQDKANVLADKVNEAFSKYRKFFPNGYRIDTELSLDKKGNPLPSGGVYYDPASKQLVINLADLTHPSNLETLLKDANRMGVVFQEEAIHAIADSIFSDDQVSNLWDQLPTDTKIKIIGIRQFKESSYQRGHEFIRAIVQGRVNYQDGKLTVDGVAISEDMSTPDVLLQIKQFLDQIRKYLSDLTGSLTKDGASPEVVKLAEDMVNSVEQLYRKIENAGQSGSGSTGVGNANTAVNNDGRGGVQANAQPSDAKQAEQLTPEVKKDEVKTETTATAETVPTVENNPVSESSPTLQTAPEVAPSLEKAYLPDPNVQPRSTETVAPRPAPDKNGAYSREQGIKRDAWDDSYGIMVKGGRTHNDDGSPYHPTILDGVLKKVFKAYELMENDQRRESFGTHLELQIPDAIRTLLNAGWVWDQKTFKMVDPNNPNAKPLDFFAKEKTKQSTEQNSPPPPEVKTNPQPEVKAEVQPQVDNTPGTGDEDTFKLQDGTEAKYRYRLVDLGDIEGHPRNTKPGMESIDTREFVAKASGPNFQAKYLMAVDPSFQQGPLVVTKQGDKYVILGGHRRSYIINANKDAYNDALPKYLNRFGLKQSDAQGMKNPVIVAEVYTDLTPTQEDSLISSLNQTTQQGTSVGFSAVAVARKIPRDAIRLAGSIFADNPDSTPLAVLQSADAKAFSDALVTAGVFDDVQRKRYIASNGSFTSNDSGGGASFMKKVILGSVIDDPRVLDRIEGTPLETKLLNGMGGLTMLIDRGQNPDVLRNSIRLEAERQDTGWDVWKFQAQQEFDFLDNRSDQTKAVQRWLSTFNSRDSRNKFSDLVARFAPNEDPNQINLFGDENKDIGDGLLEDERRKAGADLDKAVLRSASAGDSKDIKFYKKLAAKAYEILPDEWKIAVNNDAKNGYPVKGFFPTPGLTREERSIEAHFALLVSRDPQKTLNDYIALSKEDFGEDAEGRYVNADLARDLYAPYRNKHSLRPALERATIAPAGYVSLNLAWNHWLKNTNPQNRPQVLFMAGGMASGKTTSVKQTVPKSERANVAIFLDSVLANESRAEAMMEDASKYGFRPRFVFVYRPFEKAAQSAIKRFIEVGRPVRLEQLGAAHYDAQKTFLSLARKYQDKVEFEVIFNEGKISDIFITNDIDELSRKSYGNLDESYNSRNESDREKNKGKLGQITSERNAEGIQTVRGEGSRFQENSLGEFGKERRSSSQGSLKGLSEAETKSALRGIYSEIIKNSELDDYRRLAVVNGFIPSTLRSRPAGQLDMFDVNLFDTVPDAGDMYASLLPKEAKSDKKAFVEQVRKDAPVLAQSGKLLGELFDYAQKQEAELQKQKKVEKPTVEKTKTKIEDFGEKIGGAKKDLFTKYDDALNKDIATSKLSEVFPEPDYDKLLSDGVDPYVVGFIHASRDEIPTKPRQSYKLDRWVDQVKMLRDFSHKLLKGEIPKEKLREGLNLKLLSNVHSRSELYQNVGHKISLKGLQLNNSHFSLYNGEKNVDIWRIVRTSFIKADSKFDLVRGDLAYGKTKEEALENFKNLIDSLSSESKERKTTFDIYQYQNPKKPGYFIGKKLGSHQIDLFRFDDVKSARAYLNENYSDVSSRWEAYKKIGTERRTNNNARVGEDYLNGKDVTPKMFAETFGFRGVEFGNYVEQDKRQNDLNDAYNAFLDLSTILNVDPKALSLNGSLGIAFGARGQGGKNPPKAHYESEKIVINLTKKSGAGSLAHEWFHSMDNYFAKQAEITGKYLSELNAVPKSGSKIRPEVANAFVGVINAINDTHLRTRSKELDKRRSGDSYWSTNLELIARSFENYVVERLAAIKASNDYLVNIADISEYADSMLGAFFEGNLSAQDLYPYLTESEVGGVNAAFDNLFDAIQQEKTEKGVMLKSSSAGMSPIEISDTIKENAKQLGEVRKQYEGTPLWMKAPNGKPTKLNDNQWLQVRTPNFKQWFGDWEAVSRINEIDKLSPISIDDRVFNAEEAESIYRSIKTVKLPNGKDGQIVNSMFGKLARHKNYEQILKVIPKLKELIEGSKLAYFEAERNPEKHRNIVGYNNFVNKVIIGNDDFFVRFTFQHVKTDRHEFHNYSLSDVEITKATKEPNHSKITLLGDVSKSGFVDRNLAQFLSSVNPDSVSKVVDSNGEPMVVYHGGGKQNIFNTDKNGRDAISRLGSFFTDRKEVAENFGDTRSFYLSTKKQLTPSTPELMEIAGWEYPPEDSFSAMQSELISFNYAIKLGVPIEKALEMSPNERIVYAKKFWSDRGYDSVAFRDKEVDYSAFQIAVFSPNQIKSATGNNGDFSTDNPSILKSRSAGYDPRQTEFSFDAPEFPIRKLDLFKQNEKLAFYIAARFKNSVPGMDYDDMKQEARKALFQAAKGFDPKVGEFAPYAATRIRNRLIDLTRKGKNENNAEKVSIDTPIGEDGDQTLESVIPDESVNVVKMAELSDTHKILSGMIEKLPATPKKILESYLEGKTFEDIGNAVGISRQAAKMRFDNIVKVFKTQLTSKGISADGAVLMEKNAEYRAQEIQKYGREVVDEADALSYGMGYESLTVNQPGAKYEDKRQLLLDFSQSLVNNETDRGNRDTAVSRVPAAEGLVVHMDSPRSLREFAKIRRKELNKTLKLDIIGQTVENRAKLASLAQTVRNPLFETFYLVAKKGDIVTNVYAVSSRVPFASSVFAEGDDIDSFQKFLDDSGADGYFLLHNHPSGEVTPSRADIAVTNQIAEAIRKRAGGQRQRFDGHVIINHNKYTVLNENGWNKKYDLPGNGEDLMKADYSEDPILGKKFENEIELANLGKEIENRKGKSGNLITGFVKSIHNVILSAFEISPADITNENMPYFRKMVSDIGGSNLAFYGEFDNQEQVNEQFKAIRPFFFDNSIFEFVAVAKDSNQISSSFSENNGKRKPEQYMGTPIKGERIQSRSAGKPSGVSEKDYFMWKSLYTKTDRTPLENRMLDDLDKLMGQEFFGFFDNTKVNTAERVGDFTNWPNYEQMMLLSKSAGSSRKTNGDQYRKDLKDFDDGKLNRNDFIRLGGTPETWIFAGAEDLPVEMSQSVANKILRGKHNNIPREIVDRLPELMEDPIAIFQSATKSDSITVITDADLDGKKLMVAVELDATHNRNRLVNAVSSFYERLDTQYQQWQSLGLLRYINTQKNPSWIRRAGLQLPKGGSSKKGFQRESYTENDLSQYPFDEKINSSPAGSEDVALKELYDSLNERVPDSTLENQVAQAEVSGEFSVGRPDLANMAESRQGRRFVDAVDEARKREMMAESHELWNNAAKQRVSKDPQAEKRRLLEIAQDPQNNGLQTATDVKAAQLLVGQIVENAIRTGNPDQMREAQILVHAYRDARTELARAMTAGQDPFKTPEERHREFLISEIFKPTKKALKLAESALSPSDKSRLVDKLKVELKAAQEAYKQAELTMQSGSDELKKLHEELKLARRELDKARKTPDKSEILANGSNERLQKIEKALSGMGVTLEDLFSGETEVRIKADKVVGNYAQNLDEKRSKAVKLLYGGKHSMSEIRKQTGLSQGDLNDVIRDFQAHFEKKHLDKFGKGLKSDKVEDSTLLKSAPSDWTVSEEEARAEMMKALEKMGFGLGDKSKALRMDKQKIAGLKKRKAKQTSKDIPGFEADLTGVDYTQPGKDLFTKPWTDDQKQLEGVDYTQPGKDLLTPPQTETGPNLDGVEYKTPGKDLLTPKQENAQPDLSGVNYTQPGKDLFTKPDQNSKPDLSGTEYSKPGKDLFNPNEDGFVDVLDIKDPANVVRIARAIGSVDATGWDMAYEFWINAILSGPHTQIKNIAGNALNAAWDMTIGRASQALVNSFMLGKGDPTGATLGSLHTEMGYLVKGVMPGIMKGLKYALQAWNTEVAMFDNVVLDKQLQFDGMGKVENTQVAIPGKAGRIIRIPGRSLLFMDEFFKHLLSTMEVGAQAYRIAKSEGLSGQNLEKRIEGLTNQVGSDAWYNAAKKAKEWTFQEDIDPETMTGKAVSAVSYARSNVPGLRYIIPFLKTVTNVFSQGVKKSPLGSVSVLAGMAKGVWSMKDGKSFSEGYPVGEMVSDLGNQLVSTAITALLIGAAEGDDDDDEKAFLITGSRPYEDTKRGVRELYERIGLTPYTVRIGKQTFQYSGYEPIATMLGIIVDGVRTVKQSKSLESSEIIGKLFNAVVGQVKEKTFTQGLGDIAKMLESETAFADWVGSFLASWVPNVIKQPIRLADDKVRQTPDNMIEKVASNALPLPSMRQPKIDVWGRDIDKRASLAERMIVPGASGEIPITEKVDKLLINWNRLHSSNKDQWAPQRPSRKFKHNEKWVEMNEEEYVKFQQLRGRFAFKKLKTESLNVNNPKQDDLDKIRKALNEGSDFAKERILIQKGIRQ